ncbi:MAG TPA: hypothetical protein VNR17_03945 [Luteimicrobium sp.]|jgi:hypothetical protein|nr:hypothetical protein [Luteimicrobium sp.]
MTSEPSAARSPLDDQAARDAARAEELELPPVGGRETAVPLVIGAVLVVLGFLLFLVGELDGLDGTGAGRARVVLGLVIGGVGLVVGLVGVARLAHRIDVVYRRLGGRQ